jgi:hypothetical protein
VSVLKTGDKLNIVIPSIPECNLRNEEYFNKVSSKDVASNGVTDKYFRKLIDEHKAEE